MDQKLCTYKTRDCNKTTEIIDIKRSRIEDAEKIDPSGTSKQKKEWIEILRQYSSKRSLSHSLPITTIPDNCN